MKINLVIGAGALNAAAASATVAAASFLFAGAVAAGSASARIAWKKTYGACPAMPLPGNARIAGGRMDSAISEDAAARLTLDYHRILSL